MASTPPCRTASPTSDIGTHLRDEFRSVRARELHVVFGAAAAAAAASSWAFHEERREELHGLRSVLSKYVFVILPPGRRGEGAESDETNRQVGSSRGGRRGRRGGRAIITILHRYRYRCFRFRGIGGLHEYLDLRFEIREIS
jgi:hypothetical protein